ncbi:MAG: tetratricopeptide repeat protein [Prevotella sp.]|nr:tetratricopeptide repeat protein [Prevotella sp.]
MLQNSFIRRLWCLTIVMTICSTVCVLTTGAQTDRAYIRKGNRTMRAGAEGGAVDSEVSYRKALSVNSYNAQAMYNLGCALMAQQKDSAAMECFQKSVNAEKSKIRKAMAYHNMGVILQRQQQYGGAIEQYKQALRLRPNDNETRYNLVLCQRQNRNNQNNQNNNSGGDNNKDNKDKNKDKKDQNKDKNKDNQDKDNQNKKEQENKNQLSKDNAERLLNAAMQEEKQTQQRLKKAMSQPKRKNLQKNW